MEQTGATELLKKVRKIEIKTRLSPIRYLQESTIRPLRGVVWLSVKSGSIVTETM